MSDWKASAAWNSLFQMRGPFTYFALALLLLTGCTQSSPHPERPALLALLRETKFEPHGEYNGADTPEDRKPLQAAVDGAIEDIREMPDPLRRDAVRDRLTRLIRATDLYATEDRDEVGRYAVRAWRSAGFGDESGLFPVKDETVLASPLSQQRSLHQAD